MFYDRPRSRFERDFARKAASEPDFARSALAKCSNEKERKKLANLLELGSPVLHLAVGLRCFESAGEENLV